MAMSPMGERNFSVSLDSAATDYVRYVKTQATRDWWFRRHGLMLDELQIATAHRGVSSRLKAMLEMRDGTISDVTKQIELNAAIKLPTGMQQKTAVSVGTIDGWGSPLAPYQQASAAFLQSLAPFSAFDRLLGDNAFYRLGLRTRTAVESDAAEGSTVSEGQPKPPLAMSFSIVQLPAYKAIAESVVTDETILAVTPAADRQFESALQKKVAKASDKKFLEIITQDTGITSNPSGGVSLNDVISDIATAAKAIDIRVGSKIYAIMSPSLMVDVATKLAAGGVISNLGVTGGQFMGITFIPSAAATTDAIVLDATAVGADSDIVTSRTSNQASIIMQDNPTAGSHQHISAFQNNLTIILSERYFGATVLRPEGIAVITGMGTTA